MKQFFRRMYYNILNRFAHDPFSEKVIVGTQHVRQSSRTEALAFLYSQPSSEETQEILKDFPTYHDQPLRISTRVRMLRCLAAEAAYVKANVAKCAAKPPDYTAVVGPSREFGSGARLH